jgi:hypothetical protein
VVAARFRVSASLRNAATASTIDGSSGLRTPMRPEDCHWWTLVDAAVQLVVFMLRRTASPPIEPWTQMGH